MLYVMMGVAAGLVLDRMKLRKMKKALFFLCNSIGTNALWSYLFFGLQNPMLAGLEIIVLWLMILKPTFNLQKLIKLQGTCLFRIWRG
jgi:tryptophan-rich sensory protein